MNNPSATNAEFDVYADDYDAALQQGLAVSGESKEFFARGRIEYLAGVLKHVAPGKSFGTVLDYGCGTGTATPFLLELLPVDEVLGTDISPASLDVARREHSHLPARFLTLEQHTPQANMGLAFCNGVFHHIPLAERASCARSVYDSLKPGALWAFWENNPWNIGTQIVMKRCPFDRDAQTLSPPVARALLQNAGFEILRTDFLFIFPNVLKALRFIEPRVARLPLGAQYMVLCRKPIS